MFYVTWYKHSIIELACGFGVTTGFGFISYLLILYFNARPSNYTLWSCAITIGSRYTHTQACSAVFDISTDYFLSHFYILN